MFIETYADGNRGEIVNAVHIVTINFSNCIGMDATGIVAETISNGEVMLWDASVNSYDEPFASDLVVEIHSLLFSQMKAGDSAVSMRDLEARALELLTDNTK